MAWFCFWGPWSSEDKDCDDSIASNSSFYYGFTHASRSRHAVERLIVRPHGSASCTTLNMVIGNINDETLSWLNAFGQSGHTFVCVCIYIGCIYIYIYMYIKLTNVLIWCILFDILDALGIIQWIISYGSINVLMLVFYHLLWTNIAVFGAASTHSEGITHYTNGILTHCALHYTWLTIISLYAF